MGNVNGKAKGKVKLMVMVKSKVKVKRMDGYFNSLYSWETLQKKTCYQLVS